MNRILKQIYGLLIIPERGKGQRGKSMVMISHYQSFKKGPSIFS